MSIIDYYWPNPPTDISAESKEAFKKDLSKMKVFDIELEDTNRMRVSPWIRLKDNYARSVNKEWLSKCALTFFKRWLILSCLLWGIGFMSTGILIIEVPMTIGGFVSGIVAVGFLYVHRTM